MQNDEITVSDVLRDESKNLCNILKENDVDDTDDKILLTDSEYFTESEFVHYITSHEISEQNNVTILNINIANLLSKLTNFKIFLNNISTTINKPSIICVVETHLSQSKNTVYDKNQLENLIPGYKFVHAGRKQKKGGGVGIFVADKISEDIEIGIGFTGNSNFIDEVFESVSVKIPQLIGSNHNSVAKNLIILAVYRQPGHNDVETFLQKIDKWIDAVDKRNNEIIVTGDMNLDLLKHEMHLPTATYLDTMLSHKLLPKIVRPTRIKHKSATLIDHLFTRDSGSCVTSGIITTEIAGSHGYTDHFPIFTIIKTKPQKIERPKFLEKTFFTTEGHCKRREGIKNENWQEFYSLNDPNKAYDLLQEKYGKLYHDNKTTKIIKCN